jgi:hypothetical protein
MRKESTGIAQYKAKRLTARGAVARHLPTSVAADGSSVGGSETTATAVATTSTTTTASTATPAATTAAAAVANHLGKTGINLLLSFSEDSNQITSLLRVWRNEGLVQLADVHKHG